MTELWRPDRRAWSAAASCLAVVCLTASCGGGGGGGDAAGPVVASVKVEPAEALIVGAGVTTRFEALVLDAGGRRLQAAVAWSVADPDVATAAATGAAAGQATGVAGGTTTVTAEAEGVRGTAQLEVYVPDRVARYEPGRRYFGRREYVEYVPGELPVILSASHGGGLLPRETPDRTYGVVRADRNTAELAVAMAEALAELTGFAPHLVLSHLHRSKLDPNREIEEAAQGNAYAEQAWREFHEFTEVARTAVWHPSGEGLYLDIHGHSHDIDRIELGYLLTAAQLDQPDASLNSLAVVRCTSIRELGRDSRLPFSQLLRGVKSLGGLLQEEGVASVPSPADPSPRGTAYFRGGYSTRRHGSIDDGELVSGIQLEHHFAGLRDTHENRRAYAAKAARVIRRFMMEHVGYFEPGTGGPTAGGLESGGAVPAFARALPQTEACG